MKKLIALLISVAASSFAASIGYSTSFGDVSTPWGPLPFQLPQFNPALGVLTAVDLVLRADGEATLQIQNMNLFMPESYSDAHASVTINWSGGSTGGSVSGVSVAKSGTVNPNSIVYYPGLGLTGSMHASILPSSYGTYQGLGVVNFTGQANAPNAYGVGEPNIRFSALAWVTGYADITYTYDSAVPEPGTVLLLGSSLAALAMWRRAQRGS